MPARKTLRQDSPRRDTEPPCLRRWGQFLAALLAAGWLVGCLPVRLPVVPTATLSPSATVTPSPTTTPTSTPAPAVPFSLFPKMIKVPAGSLQLGSTEKEIHLARRIIEDYRLEDTSDWATNETPTTTVEIKAFYIGQYEVTNAQYAAFVFLTGHRPPAHWESGLVPQGLEQYPVTNVSWYDTKAYCEWLSSLLGVRYRLPTEAEWEYAARGSQRRLYPWGDDWDESKCNCNNPAKGPVTIGSYLRGISTHGAADMAGNVAEWTSSLFAPYPYKADDGREDPATRGSRVVRGDSWGANGHTARTAFRRSFPVASSAPDLGFRVARDLETEERSPPSSKKQQ